MTVGIANELIRRAQKKAKSTKAQSILKAAKKGPKAVSAVAFGSEWNPGGKDAVETR
jgi:hypothetical protein